MGIHSNGISSSFVEDRLEWLQAEKQLADAGVKLSYLHRRAWAECGGEQGSRLVSVRNSENQTLGAIAVRSFPSRTLPGHLFLRVHRFGDSLPETTWAPILSALKSYAQSDARVLRLSIEVFSRDNRDKIAATLQQAGFVKSEQPRSYRHTLILDLSPPEQELFAGLHKSARNHLRPSVRSRAYAISLDSSEYADKLDFLEGESRSRSGGKSNNFSGAAVLEFSRLHPGLSHVVGLFLAGSEPNPDTLVGFAWGCMHGDHVEYRAAGTARLTGQHLGISYPLLWELILWAKREGAAWFDLGGVTLEDSPQQALRGISDFKRFFSRNVEEVGEEWSLEPHPQRTRLADFLGSVVRKVGHWRDNLKAVLSPTVQSGA
jgi:hypothetical protein